MSVEKTIRDALELQRRGDHARAAERYAEILDANPDHPVATHYLGLCLHLTGDHVRGEELLRASLDLDPDNAQFQFDYAKSRDDRGDAPAAETHYRRALTLNPDYPAPRFNLASLLINAGKLSEAERLCLEGKGASPNDALLNLGRIYFYMGRIPEAIATYREMLDLDPHCAKAHSNLLLCMASNPETSKDEQFREHREWARRHATADTTRTNEESTRTSRNDRSKIRVGYVSGDFRRHSVAYFIEPIIHFHDRGRFEVVAYSDVARPDNVTRRIAAAVDAYKPVASLSDAALAELIRNDGVDLLVDLAGHTGTRLDVFAAKPAPVQFTYLGYPATTGLEAIDYRLTDAFVDPEGEDAFHSEKLIRMPHCFLTFAPPADAPPISEPPVDRTGAITFGCFSTLSKISPVNVRLWKRIMKAVPEARLVLKNLAYGDSAVRETMIRRLTDDGVSPDRITLLPRDPDLTSHLARYHDVDLALDTIPYSGTTTTCEALWMGVPIVVLKGDRHVSRVGASLLTQLGLNTFIAATAEEYANIAIQVAQHPELLRQLRPNMREIMGHSPLCDAESFTRRLEDAYAECFEKIS